MTRSITVRAAALICVAVLTTGLGCGSDKDAAVYDTVTNPHSLPAQACELLDAIEAGQLVSYDVITEAFGRLYLENQELLENEHWKEIITKLGSKFHQRADELIKKGVPSYSQAAGFYILASFSAPDDTQLAKRAELFTAWKEMTETVDYDYIPSPTSAELTDRLDFLRCFVFGDSLQQTFAEQFLVHQLLDSIASMPGMVDRSSLSRADASLLFYLEIADDPALEPLSERKNPPVFLSASRLVAVGPNRVRAELYFSAKEPIGEDLHVAITIDSVGEDSPDRRSSGPQFVHFEPSRPTSTWSPGQMQPAAIDLSYGAGTAWMEYTFSRKSEDDSGKVIFEIVRPPLTAKQPLTVERFYQR